MLLGGGCWGRRFWRLFRGVRIWSPGGARGRGVTSVGVLAGREIGGWLARLEGFGVCWIEAGTNCMYENRPHLEKLRWSF